MGLQYEQYTSCEKAEDHLDLSQYVKIFLESAAATAIGVLLVLAAGMPWCLLFVLPITIMQGTLAYCHWWLSGRLVCLDGDRTVVGMLVSIEPPWEKSGLDQWDTDYSINLLPAPNAIGDDRAKVEASAPYGDLVAEHASTKAAGLPFTSYQSIDQAEAKVCTVIHSEFEGGGVAAVLLGAQIGLALAVAALIICLAVPWPWGFIIAVALALLALLAWLLGFGLGLSDTGSPSDVNPSITDLHTNVKDASGIGKGAHILFVVGRWVYDAGHNNQGKGYNEIHPIKYCEILGTWDGAWPANIDQLTADANGQFEKTKASHAALQQENPQNQWNVHPLIDGCELENEHDTITT